MRRWIVLGAAAAGSLATSGVWAPDRRVPCDGAAEWDPNRPVLVVYGYAAEIPLDSANFREHVGLTGPDGAVPLLFAYEGRGRVHLCPEGGLAPDSDYTWEFGPFPNEYPGHAWVEDHDRAGTWTFHTAPETALPPIRTREACLAFSDWGPVRCPGDDTGYDSGF